MSLSLRELGLDLLHDLLGMAPSQELTYENNDSGAQ
jgi:hypothetical protein